MLFLLSGVYGILFSLGSLSSITYSIWIVVPVTAIFCGIIWYTFFHKRKLFNHILLAVLIFAIIIVWFQWDTLQEQIIYVVNSFATRGTGTKSITLIAVLFAILLSLIIFFFEFIIQSHVVLFLLTMVLMLFGPLIRLEIDMLSMLLLMLFQIAFAIMNMTNSRPGKSSFSIKNRGTVSIKSGIFSCVAVILAFLIAFPLTSLNETTMYNSVYSTEEYVRYTLNQIPAISANNDSVSQGKINRGNVYQTGEQKLELRVTNNQPTEKLYIQTFNGGDYSDGNWGYADDSRIIYNNYDNIIEKIYDGDTKLNSSINSDTYDETSFFDIIDDMYFLVNRQNYKQKYNEYMDESVSSQTTLDSYEVFTQEDEFWLGCMDLYIANISDGYSINYRPYYSYGQFYDYQEAEYFYYEQKDMTADWNEIDWDGNIDGFDMNTLCSLRDAYMEAIKTEYTRLPKGELSRLTNLCAQTPLTDLNEITTYILYTLNSNTSYTLTPGMAPINQDIVEYFLFNNGKGYCVHYASAAALMYRMYGIPARYVSGYLIEPSAFEYQEYYGAYVANVTDEAAHAWVEIYLEDYGWTPVEVTPSINGSMVTTYPGYDQDEMNRIMDKYGWDMSVPNLSLVSETNTQTSTGSNNQSVNSNSDFGVYNILFIILSTVVVYSICLMPLFLDYRRLRRMKKFEVMNCRKVFELFIQMLHFGNMLNEYNGTEEDFAEKLFETILTISEQDSERLLDIVTRAAYAEEMPKKSEQIFVKQVYKCASIFVYNRLKWWQKLIFKYWKVYG